MPEDRPPPAGAGRPRDKIRRSPIAQCRAKADIGQMRLHPLCRRNSSSKGPTMDRSTTLGGNFATAATPPARLTRNWKSLRKQPTTPRTRLRTRPSRRWIGSAGRPTVRSTARPMPQSPPLGGRRPSRASAGSSGAAHPIGQRVDTGSSARHRCCAHSSSATCSGVWRACSSSAGAPGGPLAQRPPGARESVEGVAARP